MITHTNKGTIQTLSNGKYRARNNLSRWLGDYSSYAMAERALGMTWGKSLYTPMDEDGHRALASARVEELRFKYGWTCSADALQPIPESYVLASTSA